MTVSPGRALAAARSTATERAFEIEAMAWLGILLVAAALRLPDLGARGTWDADQGHDMLVLRHLVFDGVVPLVGPPTSIGGFHHGVLYYALLAPAAFVSGADPVAVTTWIGLGGILAVVATGWLARSIAGPLAGLIAGFVLAVSASAVEESIFIWNPNVVALWSSIALAAAWRAHVTGRTRWWVLSAVAAVVTMHSHVLGVILTPILAALLIADWRAGRRVAGAAIAWIAIAAVSYLPLAIHELVNGASELRALIAFVGAGGGASAVALPVRLVIVLVRVLSWPLSGLATDAPLAALLATALVAGIVVWRGWLDPATDRSEQTAVRWLGLGLVWAIVALAIAAPSLATVVPGLPNDHYHAFADPMVVAVVGIGTAAALRQRAAVLRAVAAVAVAAIAAFNLATQPPAVAPDGGWQAARAAAERTADAVASAPFALTSLPTFKSDEALRMPLETLGHRPVLFNDQPPPGARLVVICDQLFHDAIGAACGGPAEDAAARQYEAVAVTPHLVDRFEAAPGRWISIYRLDRSG